MEEVDQGRSEGRNFLRLAPRNLRLSMILRLVSSVSVMTVKSSSRSLLNCRTDPSISFRRSPRISSSESMRSHSASSSSISRRSRSRLDRSSWTVAVSSPASSSKLLIVQFELNTKENQSEEGHQMRIYDCWVLFRSWRLRIAFRMIAQRKTAMRKSIIKQMTAAKASQQDYVERTSFQNLRCWQSQQPSKPVGSVASSLQHSLPHCPSSPSLTSSCRVSLVKIHSHSVIVVLTYRQCVKRQSLQG